MPSKLKMKKSKSKRSVSTACWMQNDDGTLSLTIGSKKSNTDSETSDISTSPESDSLSKESLDCNGNFTNGIIIKSPQLKQSTFSIATATTTTTPTTILNSPIKILKSNWSQNVLGYRERQQMKRHDEMTKE